LPVFKSMRFVVVLRAKEMARFRVKLPRNALALDVAPAFRGADD